MENGSASVRMALLRPDEHLRSVAALAAQVRRNGGSPVIVTTNRSFRDLQRAFADHGVPDVQVVDAISSRNGLLPEERPPNVLLVRAPTLLELIVLQTEKAVRRAGPRAHVIVDSLNTLLLHNGPQPLQEFVHYFAMRLREMGVGAEFLVTDARRAAELQELMQPFMDETAIEVVV